MGTATEIYDYLRMLFARIGKTYSPVSGEEVKRHGISDIVATVTSYPEGTRLIVLTEISVPEGRTFAQQLEIYLKEGFSRLEKKGEFIDIAELLEGGDLEDASNYRLLIDRLSVSNEKDEISRLTDSVETAYYEGHDECIIKIWTADGQKEHLFSKRFTTDGMEFREPKRPDVQLQQSLRSMRSLRGFGKVLGISEDLVIPDKSRSVYPECRAMLERRKDG